MTGQFRSTPATARTTDGRDVPVQIVTPAWTRPELRSFVRRDRDEGDLTRGQARRIIARDKADNIMAGPGTRDSGRAAQERAPGRRTRGRASLASDPPPRSDEELTRQVKERERAQARSLVARPARTTRAPRGTR
jgi:hypothetical protein